MELSTFTRESDPAGRTRDVSSAAASVAWIVLANKPVYPIYVWGFVGSGALASCVTMAFAPLYAAIALLARRASLWARIGLPIVGTADTIMATKLFGPASGAELYFAPCAMIAAVSFTVAEQSISRAIGAGILIAFVLLHGNYGAPWHEWDEQELARLLTLNSFAVASLMVFLIWRFAGASRG